MPERIEDELPEGETVELEDVDNDVEEHEDGSATIRMQKNNEDTRAQLAHFANIVDEVDRTELQDIVTDLLEKIERDKEARAKRDKLYEEGLRRTGLGDDAPGGAQFSGATRLVHPMLIEACVDFSARVMKEIFPANGPVRTKIIGRQDRTKADKAQRKADYLNWQTTQQMPEFRGELEQLTTQIPLGGAQYLKLLWNTSRKRPLAEFIPIDDIYLPFAATNFYSAERKTHVQYITALEYSRRVKSGMYIDIDLTSPDLPEYSKSTKANDKIEGREESSYNEDGLRTVFEIYTWFAIGDEEVSPYILTIDKSTEKPLALYRNWEEADESREELEWIVEFPFVPWRGAYPIGLTHMIGGLAGGATGALRALLDSAHIQNIPTVLKLKGGPNGQTLNLQPTEVVEMDGGALVDDIRKLAMPMPFPGPSGVLFQLLGFLVDAGKGVVQTSFEKLADSNKEMPVGTTLAIIEQGMVVFSSIHSRLHNAMARVFKILHRLNAAYLTDEDIAAQGSGLTITPADFDNPLDVVPISDPQIFSETQRFAQVQALIQRAAAMPQLYEPRRVEEMFLHSMKLPEDVLVPKPGSENMDPVSENVAATMGRPLYVLPKQDHIAHLKAHLGFLKSPLFGQNPVIIRSFLWPMATHLRDHLLNYYLTETHEAVDQAQKQNLIQAEADEQAQVILQVQQAIEQQLGGFAQELAQIDQMAQQFKPAPPPMPQDNSLQVAQMNLQAKTQESAQRGQIEQQKLQSAQQTEAQKRQSDQAKLTAQMQSDEADRQSELYREQLRQQSETNRAQASDAVRYQMNTDDNQTAMHLAAAEIASGERVAVSTGTGVNPNP